MSKFVEKGDAPDTSKFVDRVRIAELFGEGKAKYIDKQVHVFGWVQQARDIGKVKFLQIFDESEEPLQIVISPETTEAASLLTATKCQIHTFVEVKGKFTFVINEKTGKPYPAPDVLAETVVIIGDCDPIKYPLVFGKDSQMTPEFLRKHCHLRSRTQTQRAVLSVASAVRYHMMDYYGRICGFQHVDVPLITENECEGGADPLQATRIMPTKSLKDVAKKQSSTVFGKRDSSTLMPMLIVAAVMGCFLVSTLFSTLTSYYPLYKVSIMFLQIAAYSLLAWFLTRQIISDEQIDFAKDFFGKRVFLTVSSQLHLEALALAAMGAVYTFTCVCRGEPSNSGRHKAEFIMFEYEISALSAKQNMDYVEKGLKHIFSAVLKSKVKQLQFLEKRFGKGKIKEIEKAIGTRFVRIMHRDAITILREHVASGKVKFIAEPKYTDDLATEHEKYLVDHVFHNFVFVRRYPKKVKAFYMPVVETDEDGIERVENFDLLCPGIGEIVGGSQRIDKADELTKAMKDFGMDDHAIESLDWYVDLRRFGSAPHGGCGIGFDRVIMYLTGVANIRDTTGFYRAYRECSH